MKRCFALLAMLTLTSLALGCESSANDSEGELTYTVVNDTGHELRNVVISGTSRNVSLGTIDRDTRGTISHPSLDLPASIQLHWGDRHDRRRSTTLNLHDTLGSDYHGPVRLTINRLDQVNIDAGN